MIRHVLPTLAAAALALGALPAVAQQDELLVRSQAVTFSDLDLANSNDARVLMGRLRVAASRVCEVSGAPDPLIGYAQRGRCMDAALAAAVHDVNSPTLTALHTRNAAPPVVLAAR